MDAPYLWPDTDATKTLNALLSLPATGGEQDWEVEMADISRLPEMLALFNSGSLDLECRSALALLMLHALDFADVTPLAAINSVKEAFENDRAVKHRMQSYWSHHGPMHRVISRVLSSAI